MPTGQLNDDRLRDVLDRFNQHDLDGILASFAHDAVFESPRGPHPWGTRFEGKEAVRQGLAARFEGIPDVHYGDDRHFVCGDRGATGSWSRAPNEPDSTAIGATSALT